MTEPHKPFRVGLSTGRRGRASRRALAGAVMAGSLVAACKTEVAAPAPPPPPPQPVQVMVVRLSQPAESWSYVGVVRPRFESDLGFRVGGKIVERLVDIGQHVESGQIIARLDATDLRLAVEAQEAELAAALSSREQAVAAEARYRTLLQQGHVARAALDQRVAAADEARGRVERVERSLAIARNQVAYAELRAEQGGVVSALPVEVGQVVAAGQLVARLARLEAIEAEVAIPEQMIDSVKAARASAEVWSGTGERIGAALRELSPEADRVSRTYRARFALKAATPVELGRTVTVHLERGGAGRVAQIPLAAVMSEGKGPSVWAVDPSGTRVRRVNVEIATLARDHAVVSDGLAAGDRIVTLGVHKLDEAMPVRIVEQRAAWR